jgi:hypothetical protein
MVIVRRGRATVLEFDKAVSWIEGYGHVTNFEFVSDTGGDKNVVSTSTLSRDRWIPAARE